jgi:hypothetical protein
MEEPSKVILDLLGGEVVFAAMLAILLQESNALQVIKIGTNTKTCSHELVREDVGGCPPFVPRNDPMCLQQATGTVKDPEVALRGLQTSNLHQL